MNINFIISAGTLLFIAIGGYIYFTIQDKREQRRQSSARK
jgi:hypothetical protein